MGEKKPLGLLALTFINVIAIDNLRTLPFAAEFGLSSIFFYAIAALFFLLPIGLIAAELATTWPERGGIYIWIREAFGHSTAFAAAWVQWIYNVLWYPIALTFVVSTLHQTFSISTTPSMMGLEVALLFWLTTFANCFGMRFSSIVSTIGACIGTLLPMVIIIMMAAFWLYLGHPSAIAFHMAEILPTHMTSHTLPFLSAILFGLIGLEMSATHADDVLSPSTTFPKALAISSLIILLSLMASTLAIAIVLPPEKLNIVTGISQAFSIFSAQLHLSALSIPFNILIVIGGISSIATWVIGPSKALHIAAKDGGYIPSLLGTNRSQVPSTLLYLQAIIVSIIGYLYHFMPDIKSIYMVLTALTSQLALMVYIVLFLAAAKLRICQKDRFRPYRIPGPNALLYLLSAAGILACTAGILFGWIAPEFNQVKHYTLKLALLATFLVCAPYLLKNKR